MGDGRQDFFDMMGDVNQLGFACQLLQDFQKPLAGGDVEPGAGFVEHQQGRTVHQCARQQDPPRLAVRHASEQLLTEVFDFQQVHAGFRPLFLLGADLLPQPDTGEEAGFHHLEAGDVAVVVFLVLGGDVADPFADLRQAVPLPVVEPVNRAAVDRQQFAEDEFQQSGFAGAVVADQRPVFTGADGPVDELQNRCVFQVDGGVFDLDQKSAHGRLRWA